MSSPQQPTYIIPQPTGPNWKTPVLVGALVLLGASNIYQYVQLDHVRTETAGDVKKMADTLNAQVEQMRIDSSAEVKQSRQKELELQTRLADSRRAAENAVGQAKADAQRQVESLQAKVAAEEAVQQKAIADAKQSADTANTQVAAVSTDVGTVKTDLGNTKSQLESTIANLKRAQGDLDSHSSLIATNAGELKALRELGERNYAEFTITKNKQFTKVADIMVELKKADPKKHKFTISITADDATVEKKDRNINEPIQFYTKKARQPYEIVVNDVRKDTIVGYLATPKVTKDRGGA
jgi:phage shock protein A